MSDYTLTPVDHEPFGAPPVANAGVKLTPVDHDPFASQPSAATSAEPTLLQKLDTGARAINLGIPFTDRLTAAVETLPFVGNDKSYSENLANERAARARLEQEHPNKAFAGRMTGGLLTSLPTIAASPGVAAGFGPALWTGVKQGLGYGAAEGLSDQPDLTDIGADIRGAVKGGAEGAALGRALSRRGWACRSVTSAVTIDDDRDQL